MTVARRDFLRGLGLAGLATSGLGCAADDGPRGTVRVAVVWSGAELAAFRAALRDFSAARRWRVQALSLGDDAASLLAGRVARAAGPDVAILPQPTLVRNADSLANLTALPQPDAAPLWTTLAQDSREIQRGVWYKVTHKSLVWYRPDVFARHDLTPPATWEQWVDVCAVLRRAGTAPLALGAADGWVLTDWFENVLLALYPETYARLAAGADWGTPEVRDVLDRLAEVWSTPGTFPDGVERALLTQFGESVLQVAARDRAAMVVGSDYAYTVARRYAPDRPLDWFRLPAPAGGQPPVLVGGDLAVLLEPAGSGGKELIEWLSGADAARRWARSGGFVSLRSDVTGYPAVYRDIPDQVRRGPGLAYDLSDRLPPGPLAGGDGRRGLAWVLQGFLRGLGRGEPPGELARDAVERLDRASREDR